MKKLSEQIDASALCSYALWEGVSNLENKVEMLTKQNDDLLAYNQTRTYELAASVEHAVNLKKQRDELLAALEAMLSAYVEVPQTVSASDATDKAYEAITRTKAIPNAPDVEAEGLIECDSCPNVTAGCLGKCMKSEVA